jgi:hypothetical protein
VGVFEKNKNKVINMHKMEVLFIPSSSGIIKIYIYGFIKGSAGKVYATLNDVVSSSKGYNKKRTIIKAVSKLHQSLSNQR